MFENCSIFLNQTTSKAPVQIQGTHEQLGKYLVSIDPVWKVIPKDGDCVVDGQKFKGTKLGAVGLVGTVTFPDGSSLDTPEITLQVKHLVPVSIEIVPRAKAAA